MIIIVKKKKCVSVGSWALHWKIKWSQKESVSWGKVVSDSRTKARFCNTCCIPCSPVLYSLVVLSSSSLTVSFLNQQCLDWLNSATYLLCSVAHSRLTLCDPMDCSTPLFPVHHQFPKHAQIISIESVIPSHHLILCHPLLLLPSIFPSIRVFSNESVLCIRWPKDWSFSFSISPSSEYSRLISFRMHWLDLLAVQGTLKSLLQHHSSKASILRHLDFFIVQVSHP